MKKSYRTIFLYLLLMASTLIQAQNVPELLKDINPGDKGSNPGFFCTYNYQLYFTATNGTYYGLYRTDGTEAGTVKIKEDMSISKIFVFNDAVYFYDSSDRILWRTNGTSTYMVKNLGYTISDSFYVWGDKIYFYSSNPNVYGENTEVWVSDGTTSGTVMLKDINPGEASSIHVNFYRNFMEYNNKLYFAATDGVHGFELWSTDGTADGTQMVKDIVAGTDSSLWEYGNLEVLNNRLYFVAYDSVHGAELWKSDGTSVGTTLLKDINIGINDAFFASSGWLHNVSFGIQKKLLFKANDGTHGTELWCTDGSASGTIMLKDINPGENASVASVNSSISHTPFGIANLFTFYFIADDGVHGTELWKTNGTAAGTVMVKDIVPGETGSMPFGTGNFETYHSEVYFRATPFGGSYHLYRTDGTEAGTEMLVPTSVTNANPDPVNMFNVGNRTLYFSAAYTTNYGNELYKLEIPYTVTTAVDPGTGGNAIGGGDYLVGDAVTLTALPVQGYEFVNWTNESGTEVATTPVYNFIMGTYTRGTYTAHFKVTLGVKEENALGLTLYPNPADQLLFIEGITENTKLTIYQLNGAKVLETTLERDSHINISTLGNGMYIGVFENDKGRSSMRIIKN